MKLKNKEISNLNNDELSNRLNELKSEMMKLNTQRALGTALKSPGYIRKIKKTIAKIYTIQTFKKH